MAILVLLGEREQQSKLTVLETKLKFKAWRNETDRLLRTLKYLDKSKLTEE